jgi:hypothetical protein
VVQNNLSGSGSIVANDSAVLIAGSIASSQTIILMNNAQLYLGQGYTTPQFMPTIDMDSTSTIHYYVPNTWNGITSNTAAGLSAAIPGMVANLDIVHSLTPGYTPTAALQFGPGGVPIGLTYHGQAHPYPQHHKRH